MRPLKGLLPALGVAASPHGLAALASIGNRPCAAHALDALNALGVDDVAVVCAPGEREDLRAALGAGGDGSPRVTYVDRTARPGLLGSVLDAAQFIGESAVVVHPATVLVRPPLDAARDRLAAGEVDAVLVGGPPNATGTRAQRDLELCRIERLIRDLLDQSVPAVDTGIQMLGPRALSEARRAGDLAGGLSSLAADGRVAVEMADQWWSHDGTLHSALEGNRHVLETLEHGVPAGALTNTRVQGRLQIHRSAILEGSTIRGPVVVGAGARIRGSYIGPYTSIGDGAEVHGAEIENSVVLPRARIEFIGRRIEESIVGMGAHIRRDFSLPHAVRLSVGEGAEVAFA